MTQQLALITGASSGIGATYAKQLAARGSNLILVARDASRLNQLAQSLRDAHGVEVSVLAADLTRTEDLQRVAQTLADNEQITMLVNNAGMAVEGEFVAGDISQIQTMLTLNIVALTQLAHAAAQAFSRRGEGTIVNIASVLALVNEMANGAYNASKAFVLSLTRNMQRELAESGVRIQAVLPGLTRTEIFERSGKSVDDLPAESVMEVEDLVAAALHGLDSGELITIPSVEDEGLWQSMESARFAILPFISLNKPASRYL
ncbi:MULTISPECIES: SDR family NAD(P)-dependent oxidoreductase [unclassified Pantoea]|uniref:SDR family NAD(P)-dependent oxidoreductase n=1 Tax=unclassified Pantoea TaxID=2630326 RepID=UPI001CD3E3EA|nr:MULTISPECIES: SDR family oxidoreductase [unclassified Pantoea]MCA1178724.1 SDR family oxidoreductase [Pantoea sp. alder69]MCA1251085.1 SDR family oxidoreductase [Pantoea sp. alder70]MCA1267213.1 SDR family oxidoreductase [Pantoea sp. alder81]